MTVELLRLPVLEVGSNPVKQLVYLEVVWHVVQSSGLRIH